MTSANVRLLTWNIQCGCDDGSGLANGWARRMHALRNALIDLDFDILCVQEALPGQLAFLAETLPEFACVSFARDSLAGEHGAIIFRTARFDRLDSGRFWLSDTPDRPGLCWDIHYRRICLWARLRDRENGARFRVFNTHFPLLPAGGAKAARLVAERMRAVADEPAILCGDFNSGPRSAAWRILQSSGLQNSERRAGKAAGAKTFHKLGIALCLDAVFVTPEWNVSSHRVVSSPAKQPRASDHDGICVELNCAPCVAADAPFANAGGGNENRETQQRVDGKIVSRMFGTAQ